MDKSQIHIYASEEDALKKVSSFEKDWNYDLLAHAGMHKTGLKLAIRNDEKEGITVLSENVNDWVHHMISDEKFTKQEVWAYQKSLLQEFLALYYHNLDKEQAIEEMFPYMYARAVKSKYYS